MQRTISTGSGPRTREWLEILIADLPEDPDLLRARREAVIAAERAFDPTQDPLAQALAVCIRSLRMRVKSLQDAVPDTRPSVVPDRPRVGESVPVSARPPSPVPTREIVRWGSREKALYHDVVNLFDLGDQTGALISLERLTLLAPKAEELRVFCQKNEALLLQTYHDSLGSLQRKVFRLPVENAIPIPTGHPEEIERILRLCDGHRRIEDLTKALDQPPLLTLVMVSHLVRSRYLELS